MSILTKFTPVPNRVGRRKSALTQAYQPSGRGFAPYPRLSTTVATAPTVPHNTTDTTASTGAAIIVLGFMVPRFTN